MIRYSVRATAPLLGQPDIAARFDQEIQGALAELGAFEQRLVVEGTPRGVSAGAGGLAGSVFTEHRGRRLERSVAIASSSFYAPIRERGRRPGRRPPVEALVLWVRRKLGVSDDGQAQRVAFLVARKIGRVGYAGAAMFERAAHQLAPIAEQRFQDLVQRVTRELGGR